MPYTLEQWEQLSPAERCRWAANVLNHVDKYFGAKHFDMGVWALNFQEGLTCDTRFCAAGWLTQTETAAAVGFRLFNYGASCTPMYKGEGGYGAIGEFLDIACGIAWKIFSGISPATRPSEIADQLIQLAEDLECSAPD